jgi:hypothetical protein
MKNLIKSKWRRGRTIANLLQAKRRRWRKMKNRLKSTIWSTSRIADFFQTKFLRRRKRKM